MFKIQIVTAILQVVLFRDSLAVTCNNGGGAALPSNAYFTPTSNVNNGDIIPITCELGYAFSCTPGYYATCDSSITYNSTTCICQLITGYCSGSPPTLPNAVNPPSTINSQVWLTTTYTCNPGYSGIGGNTPYATCLPFSATAGQWSAGVTYSCELNTTYCSSLGAPTTSLIANAIAPAAANVQYYLGFQAFYTCNEGYQSSGGTSNPPYVTCSTGPKAWTPTYDCNTMIPNYCNSGSVPATPSNAVAPGSVNTTIGAINSFTCNTGYSCSSCSGAQTTPYYTCLADTQTTGKFSPVLGGCDLISPFCTGAAPTLGNADTPTAQRTINAITYFTCDVGYKSSGATPPSYTCTSGTSFSPVTFTCDQITSYCSGAIPTLANAVAGAVTRTNGATNDYTCNTGYQSNGGSNPYYTCNENTQTTGTWSSVVFSCEKIAGFCPATGPTLANADTPTPIRTIGDSTYYTCDLGYTPTGGVTPYYTCTSATTYSQTSSCTAITPIYCSNPPAPPTILQTTGTTTPASPVQTVGGITNFNCATGYSSTGGASISPSYTCYANTASSGQWSLATYSCEAVVNFCTATAPTTSNGVSNTANPTMGTTTYFTCDMGYSASPSTPYYSCTSSGWSAVANSCSQISAYCSSASAPTLPHATATAVTTVGQQTSYTCTNGYQSSGSPTSPSYYCEPDTAATGKWTQNSYSCETIPGYCDANAASSLTNAVSQTPLTSSGSKTYLTCNEGYVSSAGAGAANAPYYTCDPNTATLGIYSNVSSTCNLISAYCTGAAPTLSNAITPTPVTTVGNSTYYTCSYGYKTNGVTVSPYYTCLAYSATAGVWTAGNIYSCVVIPLYCDWTTAPTLANAVSQTPITYLGLTTYFTCNAGYQSTGGAAAPFYSCNSSNATNGQWSPVTWSCSAIAGYCTAPSANIPTLLNIASTPTPVQTIGGLTNYTCTFGTSSSGGGATTPSYECAPYLSGAGNGKWTLNSWSCEVYSGYCNSTIAPTLSNAVSLTPSSALGATTYFTCQMGYGSSGATPPYYTCDASTAASGSWSSVTNVCNLVVGYCVAALVPSLANAAIVGTVNTTIGSVTTYTCNAGYTTSNGASPYVICEKGSDTVGTWSPVIYACIPIPNYCGANPAVNSAPLVWAGGYFSRSTGDSAVLSCQQSYTAYYSSSAPYTVTCLASGAWSAATGASACYPTGWLYSATSTTPTTSGPTTTGFYLPWWLWMTIGFACLFLLLFIGLTVALGVYCYKTRIGNDPKRHHIPWSASSAKISSSTSA